MTVENQTATPPDPANLAFGLAFGVPLDQATHDYRYQVLMLWIRGARDAGHTIAEYLRSAQQDLDHGGSQHCGTARIGTAAFDVYLRGTLNQVYAMRVDDPNTLTLLGLDQAPTPPLADRLKALAVRAQQEQHAKVAHLQKKLGEVDWVTQTAYGLTELVERANNLLRTGEGNDVDRDAVRDQADVAEIIAALLPAWADRGVHPDTETNVELVAARLTHLLDELEG